MFKENILTLAKELISIPSVSGDIEKAVEILEFTKNFLPEYKPFPFVSNHLPSLLFFNRGTDVSKFKIIFNLHLDVVPAEKELFTPIEKDGRIYGRGAFDTKAAGAVMILLFKELADTLPYQFGLQVTTDEEINGHNGTQYQIKQGVRSKFVIVSECNSNFKVTNQSKGRVETKITIKGDSAHAAYPWRGKNAVWQMYSALDSVMKAYPIPDKETYETTVSITKIESNHTTHTTIIPDTCTAYLDIRYIEKDKKTIIEKLNALLPHTATIESKIMRNPHLVTPKNTYIKQLQTITTDIRKEKLPLRFAHATSDAPFFTEVGCPAVEYGPVGDNAHHTNEWVDIQSLVDYYQILKTFLLSFEKKISS